MASGLTLKPGIDVVTAKNAIVNTLSQLKNDDGEQIYPESRVITSSRGQLSTYGGGFMFILIGDTRQIHEGLRGRPGYGEHMAVVMIVEPGTDETDIDLVNDITRRAILLIDSNPSMGVDGLRVRVDKRDPVQRRKVTLEETGKINREPMSATASFVNLIVDVADIPVGVDV